MQTSSNLLYRLYFAPKFFLNRIMTQYPATAVPIARGKLWLKKYLLPAGDRWVRVSAGLSTGMAMRLYFPREAAVWRGEHEPDVQSAIKAVVQPGWVVFDVGAAIGSLALGSARLVGGGGRVVAFEADPVHIERLGEHIRANRLEGVVELVPKAVWSGRSSGQSSERASEGSEDSSGNWIWFRYGKTARTQGGVETATDRPILADGELIRVAVTTLDDYVASSGFVPRLIKIDVEGGEAEVLRGGEVVFATHRPLVIAEIHTEQARDAVRQFMLAHGYVTHETVLYDPVPIRLLAWPAEQGVGPWAEASAFKG
jgi:FkbM family methyltransferase